MKILKNTTIVDIELNNMGITLPLTSSTTINSEEYDLMATSDSVTELSILITSGDIIVNDGTNDLSVIDGINYIGNSDNAKSVLFDDSPVSFTATTVQKAIEELAGEKADHHSGFGCVPEDQSIEIESNKQSTTYHTLKHGGFIKHSGFLRRN